VNGVYAIGSTVYAATFSGLGISTDGGLTFTNKTVANSTLANNNVQGVYVLSTDSGNVAYAATAGGLSINYNGGPSFTTRTTTAGLGSSYVLGVYVVGDQTCGSSGGSGQGCTVYAATNGGLSISTDDARSFTNKTTVNGLGSNTVYGVYVIGSTVYAATGGGLSISTDGGATFTNKTNANNGLGSNTVYGVYATTVNNITTIYAATSSGLSVSTDGGVTFTNYIAIDGLGSNTVNGVYSAGSTVYAATTGGVSTAPA
jgi:hypothetical protein